MRNDDVLRLQAQLKRFQRRQRCERPRVADLSDAAVQVLGVVARASGPIQPSEIAEQLNMASSNVAAALRELGAVGFITRERDTQDGRRVNVTVTPAGENAVVTYRALRAEWLRSAVDATLTSDEQALLLSAGALLERLADWDGIQKK